MCITTQCIMAMLSDGRIGPGQARETFLRAWDEIGHLTYGASTRFSTMERNGMFSGAVFVQDLDVQDSKVQSLSFSLLRACSPTQMLGAEAKIAHA